jgi:hypothetical protein
LPFEAKILEVERVAEREVAKKKWQRDVIWELQAR